ncbi:multidrug resistance protein (efflux pump/antiporter) [Desulforapulum autotrophicum HRM2]|uniref:Multidrug resistance protein (Efflux pump/antiporter) n=1 Tax=Desulforapulum autotrophicum (strain ATCC 43914 / DSM 3382 / VKM B-1955 / HRM2) TaxID=177437 RepID=C0QJV1_DESAH|nr:multidrug resistance protein (efflux pump/antiporter) [Desulforapulum autotrophicum]ACN13954.1 multidrug resistance protein (efflux pump/antiporter) [Desulforapulum autotrophicum HRM2]
MTIEINPRKTLTFFLCIIVLLLIANIMGIIHRILFNHDYLRGLFNLFDFNTEKNIPTLYSSITLIFASIILAFITYFRWKSQKTFFSWGVLSFIFLFLSIDEISSIHERLIAPTRRFFDTSAFFYYAWIIPYGIALIIFVVSYIKFLLEVPKSIMMLFLLSGGLFVLGAIGFEMLGGWQAELYGTKGLLYSIFYTCEELLEMLGVAVFIYTLLRYILNENQLIEIILRNNVTIQLRK